MAIIKAERLIVDPNTIRVTYDDRPESYVPADPANSDYAAVLDWVANQGGVIEDEVYPLAQRREMKMWELQNIRDSKLYADIEVDGDVYFAKERDVNLMNNTLASQERDIQFEIDGVVQQVFPANWQLANGTVKVVSYDDLKAVNAAYARRTKINYDVYKNYATQIMTSANPENIDISGGWES